MKTTICFICLLFSCTLIMGNNIGDPSESGAGTGSLNRSMSIDLSDTVIFDLSQSVINGNTVEFPVYFKSNEIVNALDFSFRFDETNFTYDTTVNLTSYLQVYSFYNSNDSTLRFTSNSLLTIGNDTPLVLLRFTSLSGQVCSPNLNTISVYLNGDPCSSKVVPCMSANTPDEMITAIDVKFFPNPASDFITINAPERSNLEIMDLNCARILPSSELKLDQANRVNLKTIPNGIYLLRISNEKFVSVKRIVVNR